jgi:hypothetical protein
MIEAAWILGIHEDIIENFAPHFTHDWQKLPWTAFPDIPRFGTATHCAHLFIAPSIYIQPPSVQFLV